MARLLVNSVAVNRSSLGVRRYFDVVMRHLAWPGVIEYALPPTMRLLERPAELLMVGRLGTVLWSPSHRGPLFARRHVVTVHDCINVEYRYRNDPRLRLLKQISQRMLDNAQVIVAISNATRDALQRNYVVNAQKIQLIKSPSIVKIASPSELHRGAENHPVILMVTNSLIHKNTIRACTALSLSSATKRRAILRVVGSVSAEGLAICREKGLRVEFFDGVDDSTLANWYATSSFFFSPSLQEGHNLPIAEAIACGARVLCSDIPVHREFYDGYVRFCDPYDVRSMTACIDDVLCEGKSDDSVAPKAVRSFVDVANEYRQLFERVVVSP